MLKKTNKRCWLVGVVKGVLFNKPIQREGHELIESLDRAAVPVSEALFDDGDVHAALGMRGLILTYSTESIFALGRPPGARPASVCGLIIVEGFCCFGVLEFLLSFLSVAPATGCTDWIGDFVKRVSGVSGRTLWGAPERTQGGQATRKNQADAVNQASAWQADCI